MASERREQNKTLTGNAKMTTARQLLEAKIAEQTTEMLLTAVRTLNTDTSIEAITAAGAIEHELSKRMTEAEFIALMDELEAEIMAA